MKSRVGLGCKHCRQEQRQGSLSQLSVACCIAPSSLAELRWLHLKQGQGDVVCINVTLRMVPGWCAPLLSSCSRVRFVHGDRMLNLCALHCRRLRTSALVRLISRLRRASAHQRPLQRRSPARRRSEHFAVMLTAVCLHPVHGFIVTPRQPAGLSHCVPVDRRKHQN